MAGWCERRVLVLSAAAVVVLLGCRHPPAAGAAERGSDAPVSSAADQAKSAGGAAPPQSTARQPQGPEAAVFAEFDARVKEYIELHRKLEDTLPKLSKNSTPEQIDSHQRALARLVQEARAGARPGSIFTPRVQVVVRRLMAQVFGGPDGAALKSSIMDENPGPMKLTVNGRYPDSVPLSTVPPQVLQGLPKLPDELEFRFIGRHLILMDEHAHIIVDLVENVLPR